MQHENKFALPLLGLLLIASTQAIGALPGESIVLDPNTGDYTLTYLDYPDDPDARIRQAIFVPATKIDPLVKSSFKLREVGEIFYTYSITNGVKSQQSLDMVLFDPVSDIVSTMPLPKRHQDVDLNTIEQVDAAGVAALTTPDNWVGRNTTSRADGLRIGWSYIGSTNGLAPGKTQTGFGFFSQDIPGVGMAQMQGDAPVPMFPAEGPQGKLAKEFAPIEQNNFVLRYAAVPTIAVPTPFDPAATLERIQAHTHTWIAKQLLDSVFSAQLDRYFQSAISAYSLNQPKVGKKHLQTMRELIHKEYPDMGRDEEHESDKNQGKDDDKKSAMIDRLAARILDFDLKYVTKRMGGDKDD